MGAKRVDVVEEVPEERFSRVSKKKKYVDLVERVRRNSRIEEDIEQYPRVRKSVGSMKIAELRLLPSQKDEKLDNLCGEVLEKEGIPWHLLDATPTQLEEIMDNWILERIAEEDIEEMPIKKKERTKNMIMKFVEKRFGEKVIKKRIGDDVVEPEILPDREFEGLREKFRQGRAKVKEFVHWEPEISINESVILSHDLEFQASMFNFIPVKPSKSTSVESSDQSKQSSEFNVDQHLSSDSTISEQFSIDLERRFRISHVLSDFSLQKKILILDM